MHLEFDDLKKVIRLFGQENEPPSGQFWIRHCSGTVLLCAFWQLSAKKRYVYGAIAFVWIVIPSLEITFSGLITAIVQGTCVRYASYAVMKTVGVLNIVLSYLLPLTLMVFCYARVILALRSEVILS